MVGVGGAGDPAAGTPSPRASALRAPQLDELVGAYPNYNEEEEERRYYRRKRLGVLKNVLAASAGGMLTYGVYLGRRPAARASRPGSRARSFPAAPLPGPQQGKGNLGARWLPFLFHFLVCRASSRSCGLATWRWGQVRCSGFPARTFGGEGWPGSGRPGRVCRLPDVERWTWEAGVEAGTGSRGEGGGHGFKWPGCRRLSGGLAQPGHPSLSSWALESGTPSVTGAPFRLVRWSLSRFGRS